MAEEASPHAWTLEQLTGRAPADGVAGLSPTDDRGKRNPLAWGVPGHLTDQEAAVYFQFKEEIAKRDADFRSTIFSFGEEEGEVWALCRWLRARKFVYDDVIKMVEEATECRAKAKENGFYPDAKVALGCEPAYYVDVYPQLYSGVAKSGAPIYISKPGLINVDAVECLTSLDGILAFHWNSQIIDFAGRLQAQRKGDPGFKKFEFYYILDLEGLTVGKLNNRVLNIVKKQAFIDQLCFPETNSKTVIVNAPRFFAATWKIIKGWLDPRTAAKIDVLAGRKQWVPKLLEGVAEDQLPSDYGGKGPDTAATTQELHFNHLKRLKTHVMYIRGNGSYTFQVGSGETLTIDVFTRSVPGAKFSVVDADKNRPDWSTDINVKHASGSGEAETTPPTQVCITPNEIQGPASVKVKGNSLGGRLTSYTFLVCFKVV